MNEETDPPQLAFSFWIIQALLCVVGLFVFGSPLVRLADFRGVGSYTIQVVLLVGCWLALDGRLAERARWRFLLAGSATLFSCYVLLNCWMLSLSSTSLGRLAGHVLSSSMPAAHLREAGVSPGALGLAFVGLVGAFFLGGLAHARFSRWRLRRSVALVGWGVAACLAVGFVAEQWTRPPHYLARGLTLPAYLQLFGSGLSPAEVASSPTDKGPLPTLSPPVARPHVLFVLLESFGSDVLEHPTAAPVLRELAGQSLDCSNALTEGTDTHLSWQAIFLDRPSFELRAEPSPEGARVLRVFRSLGYEISISASTTMDWYAFDQRLAGASGTVVTRFAQFNQAGGPGFRHIADEQATDELIEVIGNLGPQPALLILQLDATHFAYDFHSEQAVVTPYMDPVELTQLHYSQEALNLLHARYLNSAHHVDRQIGRVLAALEAKGVREETAIVVVADHGEEFSVGRVGHVALTQTTKRVPLLLSLPGVAPRKVTRLTSTPAIWPTLLEHLGVDLPPDLLRGASLLSPPREDAAVLTYSTLSQHAHLTTNEQIVQFYAERVNSRTLRLHPIGLTDREGQPIAGWLDQLREDDSWRRTLERLYPTTR